MEGSWGLQAPIGGEMTFKSGFECVFRGEHFKYGSESNKLKSNISCINNGSCKESR